MTIFKAAKKSLELLRALRRGKIHGGYRWAMVCADGELLCEGCVVENYRQVFRATYEASRRPSHSREWQCVGLANSGESETEEYCAHCQNQLWAEPE